MNQSNDKFLIRFPEGMRNRIKEQAEHNRRSMTAEIVVILESALFDPLEMKKGGEVSA